MPSLPSRPAIAMHGMKRTAHGRKALTYMVYLRHVLSLLRDDYVIWQPQPPTGEQNVNAVERAMDIVVQPAVHAFYTTQFAGDMPARFAGITLTLLQTWSEDDLQRVQENLIGHLVTQKRLKLSPTLFIATLDSELDVISVCNLSGEVVKETIGTRNRETLAPSLAEFLTRLEPLL